VEQLKMRKREIVKYTPISERDSLARQAEIEQIIALIDSGDYWLEAIPYSLPELYATEKDDD
jgi:hypothetical protein